MSTPRGRPQLKHVDGVPLVVWTIDRKRLQHRFDPLPQMIRTANAAGFNAPRWHYEAMRTCIKFVVHCEPRKEEALAPAEWAHP